MERGASTGLARRARKTLSVPGGGRTLPHDVASGVAGAPGAQARQQGVDALGQVPPAGGLHAQREAVRHAAAGIHVEDLEGVLIAFKHPDAALTHDRPGPTHS